VWAPLSPHLRGPLRKAASEAGGSSSASSSDNSIYASRVMQTPADSRVPTARLSGRGRPQSDVRKRFWVEASTWALATKTNYYFP
jgi:hypothetical protein